MAPTLEAARLKGHVYMAGGDRGWCCSTHGGSLQPAAPGVQRASCCPLEVTTT